METEKMRIDKWLWCVRIFKSRTISSEACKANQITMDGIPLKPSHLIKPGDLLTVKKEGFNLQYRVIKLLQTRVGAPIAQTCYENVTPADEFKKFDTWYLRKVKSEYREKGLGRPTKKDRRNIEKLKGR